MALNMQINHIFNEKIENNIWTLSFKEFSWILPVRVHLMKYFAMNYSAYFN